MIHTCLSHLRSCTLMVLLAPTLLQAAPLNIVGSSTVYPFAKVIANALHEQGKIQAPKFSVTGSGKGIQLFCASNAPASPDITNASRRMKSKELETCLQHGVKVSEMLIGYDGIVIVQSDASLPMQLTGKSLFLALAQKVPSQNGRRLIANPYQYWDEIDPNLGHRPIRVFGPPQGSGTRSMIEEKIMDVVSRDIPLYQKFEGSVYHQIRQDGVFISDGEAHKRDITIIKSDHDAIAIFGYSYYYNNPKGLKLIPYDGITPNTENISSMTYPLARPLYVYIKRSHWKQKKDMPTYIHAMMSDRMIGAQGICVRYGLIPLPGSVLNAYRLWLKYDYQLSTSSLLIQS